MLGVFEGFGVIAIIIAVGFLLGRYDLLGSQGQLVLARLTFFAATPALLFTTLANTDVAQVFSPALLATGGSSLVAGVGVFLVVFSLMKRSLGESTMAAWAVSYVNIGNLGVPIALYVLGDISYVAPVLLFQLLVLAPIGMALLESRGAKSAGGRAGSARPGRARRILTTVVQILRNPILIACVLGVSVSATGVELPTVIAEPISYIGGIAVPGALLAFGISLKDGWKLPAPGSRRELTLITVVKLVVQPTLAWFIGGVLLGLDGLDLLAIVVTSALPAAQNVYVYAIRFQQSVDLARDAVFITTILSVPAVLVATALFG